MKVVKPGADREVPRGVVGGSEISQASTGAENIYMAVFRVPPGAQSRPHYHEGCESAVYLLPGGVPRPAGRAVSPALPGGLRERRLHAVRFAPSQVGRPPRARAGARA